MKGGARVVVASGSRPAMVSEADSHMAGAARDQIKEIER